MRKVLCIEYKGTNYTGWQSQTNQSKKTIQYHIDKAISYVANEKIKSICAGRTDTGVHATNQIIHFDTKSNRTNFNWISGINSRISNDIMVKNIFDVDESFHARFSAISRTYKYFILNAKLDSTFLSEYVLYYKDDLDLKLIRKTFNYILGEKDFSCFRSAGCQSSSPIKNILKIDIKKRNNILIFTIEANSFLYHMIRNLIGTLLDIGIKKTKPSFIQFLLDSKDRKKAGKMASSSGLYLTNIKYPKKFKIIQTKSLFLI